MSRDKHNNLTFRVTSVLVQHPACKKDGTELNYTGEIHWPFHLGKAQRLHSSSGVFGTKGPKAPQRCHTAHSRLHPSCESLEVVAVTRPQCNTHTCSLPVQCTFTVITKTSLYKYESSLQLLNVDSRLVFCFLEHETKLCLQPKLIPSVHT